MNVESDTKFQGMKGLFSGESLFFIHATCPTGAGRVYYNSYGAIKPMQIQQGQTITIDTGHVVAFTPSLDYSITGMGSFKSTMLSGEGLVMKFRGNGTLYLQTRNVSSIASWLTPRLLG